MFNAISTNGVAFKSVVNRSNGDFEHKSNVRVTTRYLKHSTSEYISAALKSFGNMRGKPSTFFYIYIIFD